MFGFVAVFPRKLQNKSQSNIFDKGVNDGEWSEQQSSHAASHMKHDATRDPVTAAHLEQQKFCSEKSVAPFHAYLFSLSQLTKCVP